MDFPIICFAHMRRNDTLVAESSKNYRALSERQLSVTCRPMVSWSYYKHVQHIVDSQGNSYPLANAEKVSSLKGGIWSFLKKINANQAEVILTFSDPSPITIDDLRRRVISIIDSDPGYWSEVCEIEPTKTKVQQAQSVREIIETMLDPPS